MGNESSNGLSQQRVDGLLAGWSRGDSAARDRLIEEIYPELRRLAGKVLNENSSAASLQTTELVHELFLKLIRQNRIRWEGKSQFFAIAGRLLRRLIVDHVRHRSRLKRGGHDAPVPLSQVSLATHDESFEVLALDRALEKMAAIDPRAVELVELRFFVGLSHTESAETLGISRATASRRWRFARAWLRQELSN